MINNYSPQDVIVTILHKATGVAHVVGGFKADDFLTIESPDDEITEEELLDNTVTRVFKSSALRRVTMKIDQGSSSNDVFSAMYKYDKANKRKNAGIFTASITDTSGRSYLNSSECYLKLPTNQGYGQNSGSREWMIVMVNCNSNIGGNSLLDVETQNILEKFGITIDDTWKMM